MHYTCAAPEKGGGRLRCPICKTESDLKEAEVEIEGKEMPYWHLAEVGAPMRKFRPKKSPEVGFPPFPALRWPSQAEAAAAGFSTIRDWYIEHRIENGGGSPPGASLEERTRRLREIGAEFKEIEARRGGNVSDG